MKAFKLDINHVYDVLANDDGGIEELLEDPALEDPEALSELFAIVAMAEAAAASCWASFRALCVSESRFTYLFIFSIMIFDTIMKRAAGMPLPETSAIAMAI